MLGSSSASHKDGATGLSTRDTFSVLFCLCVTLQVGVASPPEVGGEDGDVAEVSHYSIMTLYSTSLPVHCPVC